ncbi:MAG TPA: hypothetical protein PKK01_00200 [Mycobacterium sp.]|nr:MAG: hypothetical protein E6Q56_05865 [Mycobacterium sp.]HOB47723.1 hypothetical protein [Mycobacterium sp.]HPZ94192.1 hypothetical protein [Mycobacterium sp.]HQE14190.1 hypothetical protein [Mycobacterium sp.]
MCFSKTADLVTGTALIPVAVLTLREVRHLRELPFAMLPAIFAAHQFFEVVVWEGLDGNVSAGMANLAMRAYLFIAWPLLPTLVPLAVLLLEPQHARLRVAPFLALGAVVSAYLGWVVLLNPVQVIRHPYGLEYVNVVQHPLVWAVLYIVAVIGAPVMSRYRSIVAFGVLNLIGLIVVAVFYANAFASLWCVFAAVCSVLMLVHMVGRRKLSDSERLHGVSPALVG